MATESVTTLHSNAANQDPRFTILVDPPGSTWETSSIGMLYGLKSLSDTINNIDMDDRDEIGDSFALIQSTLAVFCRQLIDRNGLGVSAEDQIRAIIRGERNEHSDSN